MVVLKRLLPAASLICVMAACSESLGPESVNPADLNASAATLRSTFDNVAFQSMADLAFLFPVYPGIAALRATLPENPGLRPSVMLANARRRVDAGRVYASLRSNPTALFPANVLGKTLEWNATNHAYEVGNLTGAPANGLRIVIYTVSPITGEPNPAQQLGYVELTDESSPQADRLGVLITLGQTPVADYLITAIVGTSTGDFEAEGYIKAAAGNGQVDFDFVQSFDDIAQTLDVISDLAGNNGGAIHVAIGANPLTANIDVGVSQGRNDLNLEVDLGTSNVVTGIVKFNNHTVATIAGTLDVPTFTGANGRTLTAAEIGALADIFERAVEIAFDLNDAVFRPGLVVF